MKLSPNTPLGNTILFIKAHCDTLSRSGGIRSRTLSICKSAKLNIEKRRLVVGPKRL